MSYIDTDLAELNEIFSIYKQLKESIELLQNITHSLYEDLSNDINFVKNQRYSGDDEDDEIILDILILERQLRDKYHEVMQLFKKVNENDFTIPFQKLCEILEDYLNS